MTLSFVLFGAFWSTVQGADDASPYRVEWTTPSENWGGSMPLGNGEVCVNAWFDGSGVARLLFARADSWDEFGALAKVGSVEIDLLAGLDRELATPFRQTLDVETGVLTVVFGPEGKETRVNAWVDTNRPVVVFEIDGDLELAPNARICFWRVGDGMKLESPEVSDLWWGSDEGVVVAPDVYAVSDQLRESNRVAGYHRNVKTKFYDEIAATQGLDEFPGYPPDPYVNRTFGVLLSCDDGEFIDASTVRGKPSQTRRFEIAVHTAQTSTVDEWLDEIIAIADDAAKTSVDERRAETIQYWRDLSERSWVRFSPNQQALANASSEERAAVAAETFDVTRAYALQRFLFACQGRGAHPIKYNGGLFTVATPGKPASHDYRRWGPGYWHQNTRHAYYSMFNSGDFEFEKPFFDLYCSLVPLCEYRTKKYLDADGAFFPECIYFTGAIFPETYGLTPWNEREDKLQTSRWHKYEWVTGLELAFLAMRYYEYTLDDAFLQEKAIPTANAVLRFFDSFYEVDPATGKLWMNPAQAVETWWDCDNPAPEIAGIRAVIGRLLALPEEKTRAEDREFWRALLAKTPEVPTRVDEETGKRALAPADRYELLSNLETPELYPVFPFRLYSFEKPDVELALNALELRTRRYHSGWAQDDLFCSYLGAAEEARDCLVQRSRTFDPYLRFPAFWAPNWDWSPDQNHGGVLVTAAQSLVLQADGDAIYLAPALPKEWDVDFKLWAPGRTTVQGAFVDGRLQNLKVEPEERAKDVTVVGEK